MGCDIHFYVERRVDGVWITADTWIVEDDEEGSVVDYDRRFYTGRDYELFGILAGVRRPQSSQVAHQGIPEDASPEYKAVVERWDSDGHTHSYFTLAEFLAYDWTQEAKFEGWITLPEWVRARDNPDGPDVYCGGVGGGTIRHCSMEQFEEAWAVLRREKGWPEDRLPRRYLNSYNDGDPLMHRMVELLGSGEPYCHYKWTVPYYKSARRFWSDVIPRLLRLGAPEDVRCVFFFDN